jgi:hypothetical protein
MKPFNYPSLLAAALLASLAIGCGRQTPEGLETSSPEPLDSPQGDIAARSNEVEQTRALTDSLEPAVDSDAAHDPDTADVQPALSSAQSFLDQRRHLDAAAVLDQLTQVTLNPEQTKQVDDFRAEIQQLAAQIESKFSELKLLVEKKQYAEATATLQELGNLQLTPQQEQWVQSFKAQIQATFGEAITETGSQTLRQLLPATE